MERHLTGKETEPWELIYFKVYKSQLAVIEQALETAALMLGSDKSRGYMLEMICADFLAGANLEAGNSRRLDTFPRPALWLASPAKTAGISRQSDGTSWRLILRDAPVETRCPTLQGTASKDSGARRMALPILRLHEQPSGSSHSVPEFAGR